MFEMLDARSIQIGHLRQARNLRWDVRYLKTCLQERLKENTDTYSGCSLDYSMILIRM